MTKRERIISRLRADKWNTVVVRDAIVYAPLSAQQKGVLHGLCTHRGKDGRAKVSARLLGQLANVHKDNVGKVLHELEGLGLVKVGSVPCRNVSPEVDLSPLPSALLALPVSPPEGQKRPSRRDKGVPRQGTDSAQPESAKCPLPGSKVSLPKVESVPSQGTEGIWKGSKKGSICASTSDARQVPLTLEVQEAEPAKTTAKLVITRALTAGYHVQPLTIVKELNRYLSDKQPGRGNGTARPGTGRGPAQPNQTERPSWLKSK